MHQAVFLYKYLSIDQLLHDLNWAINSGSILKIGIPEFEGQLLNKLINEADENLFLDWFNDIKDKPENLIEFFNSDEQLILGKYFERLLSFFFENYHQFELFYSGKQLFHGKTTLGELDFIYRDIPLDELIHLEVAVKYYMGFKNSSKHDMWIGPNGSDSLDKKMKKFEKQLKLSENMDQLQLEINSKKVLINGYLFKHYKSANWPYFSHISDENGIWMYIDEMENVIDKKGYYLIMPKHSWLSFYIDPDRILLSASEAINKVNDQIKEIGKGIMLVKINEQNNSVLEKYIIAPKKWPRL